MILNRTLYYGLSGDDVKMLQKRLVELGYLTGTPSGVYDARTEAAVIMFEGANGMSPTYTYVGYAGQWVADKLNSGSAVSFAAFSKGSSGNAVLMLQTYLRKLRYLSNTPNGTLDQTTVDALNAFQKINGLSVTGNADYATLIAL